VTAIQVTTNYKASALKWEEVRERVFSQYQEISSRAVSLEEDSAFFTRTPFNAPKSFFSTLSTSSVFCAHYKKTNHTEDKCFLKFSHLFEQYKKKFPKREKEEKKKGKGKETEEKVKHVYFAYLSQALLSQAERYHPLTWFIDSAASGHMCSRINLLSDYKSCLSVAVEISDGVFRYGCGCGSITFSYTNNSIPYTVTITDILYVPYFKFNLLSVGQLKQSKLIFCVENVCINCLDGLSTVPLI
jgi:hypothetical protein